MLEAVFFDMDNTLVDTEWAAAKAVCLGVESFGKVLDPVDEAGVIGLPWNAVFDNTISKYELPIDRENFKDLVLAAKAKLMADDPRILPGAIEAVKTCAARWPVAVVSGSYRHEVAETLELIKLEPFIRFFISNEDVNPGKPHPGPFLEASRRLEVEPANCLVFEDSEVGIAAAKAAGMICIAIEIANYGDLDLSAADRLIPSLEVVTDSWLDELASEMYTR